MAVFSDCFFVLNPDFDHGMMTCRDMFHMFSLTCLSCEKGEWHSVRSEFGFFFEPDFDETDKVEVGVTQCGHDHFTQGQGHWSCT